MRNIRSARTHAKLQEKNTLQVPIEQTFDKLMVIILLFFLFGMQNRKILIIRLSEIINNGMVAKLNFIIFIIIQNMDSLMVRSIVAREFVLTLCPVYI